MKRNRESKSRIRIISMLNLNKLQQKELDNFIKESRTLYYSIYHKLIMIKPIKRKIIYRKIINGILNNDNIGNTWHWLHDNPLFGGSSFYGAYTGGFKIDSGYSGIISSMPFVMPLIAFLN